MLAFVLACVGAVAGASPAQEPPPVDLRKRVEGRFVDADGQPVFGVELELFAATSPAPLEPIGRALSRLDGTFVLGFEGEPLTTYELRTSSPEWMDVLWRIPQLQRGQVVRLVDTQISPAAGLTVYVVDPEGRLLVEGWSVELREVPQVGGQGRQQARQLPVPASDGFVRFERAPATTCTVRAIGPAGESYLRSVRLTPGVETELELGPGLGAERSAELSLRVFDDDRLPVALGTSSLTVTDPDGRAFAATSTAPGRYVVPVIGPGPWRVSCHDPLYLPQEVLLSRTSGTSAQIDLVGSSSLELIVVDAASGASVEEYTVTARPVELGGVERTLVPRAHTAGANIVFDRVVPRAQELTVATLRHAPRTLTVHPRPGEVERVRVELQRGVTARGRVLAADGSPVAGHVVTLDGFPVTLDGAARAAEQPSSASGGAPLRPIRIGSAVTDPDGTFVIGALEDTLLALTVDRGLAGRFEVPVDLREPQTLEVRLPADGELVVRLRVPEGIPSEALLLDLDARVVDPTPLATGTAGLQLGLEREAGAAPEHGLVCWTARAKVPAGRRAVNLRALSPGRSHEVRVQGSADVPPGGTVELVLDTTEQLGTTVTLVTGLPGEAAQWLTELGVERVVAEGAAERRPVKNLRAQAQAGAPLLPRVRLLPGEYRVVAAGPGWTYRGEATARLEAGAVEPLFQLPIPLVSAAVVMRREDGTALADVGVFAWSDLSEAPASGPSGAGSFRAAPVGSAPQALRSGPGGVVDVLAPPGPLEVMLAHEPPRIGSPRKGPPAVPPGWSPAGTQRLTLPAAADAALVWRRR